MGRDVKMAKIYADLISFNPRARMGRDFIKFHLYLSFILFQSTRPHGARLTQKGICLGGVRFNPRARMGRDFTMMLDESSQIQFQSTRPHGARL